MEFWDLFSLPSLLITVATLLAIYIYRLSTANFDFFEKQGIPGPKPRPFIGNVWGIWREKLPYYDLEMVKKYGKTFGCFVGQVPNLFTVEEDLIKRILVKDFELFVNRRDMKIDVYAFRKFLTLLQDQEWKDVRSAMSPVFTSGKIKRMSGLIKDCAETLSEKLMVVIKDHNGKFEVKKYFGSFTMDVIARCAFGMKIDNLGEKDDPFTQNAAVLFNPPANKTPAIALSIAFPKFGSLLAPLFLLTSKEFNFYFDVLKNLIRSRENSTQKFHDFIEITGEALAESVKTGPDGKTEPMWTKEEAEEIILAQSALFMLAGYDTTGTTLTNLFYLLAKHPEVQERLYKVICDKLEESDGEITHELVNSIPYAEQVINEALRLIPPAFRVVERECSRDIQYGNIFIKKGMAVTIPVYALHRLEEYYPDPERFDPERWSPENKAKISPYVFLPFGTGPRNCLGMRFAMEEMKFVICTVLKKFRLFPVYDTPDKLDIDEGFVMVAPLKSFNLGIELRD